MATSGSSRTIELRWFGPFSLLPTSQRPWLFDAPEADQPGVYLFAVPKDDSFLGHYVGMTTRSFRSRLTEHVQCTLGGAYWIYDAGALFDEQRQVVRYRSSGDYRHFLAELPALQKHALAYLEQITIFIAPLAAPKVDLERIESALITALRAVPECAPILDNPRVSRAGPSLAEERLAMVWPTPLTGLGQELVL